jgi:hypothetical protein
LQAAIAAIEAPGDPGRTLINQVVEVTLSGEVSFYTLPAH